MTAASPLVRLRFAALLVNGAAVLVTVAAFFWLKSIVPPPQSGTGSLAGRLGFAFGLAVWPAGLVLAMVVAAAGSRVASGAFDPILDPESRTYRINQRVLTNTVEQTIVFLPLLLALAARLGPSALGALTVLAGLFVAGRIAFWIGYRFHPYARAPGMAMTLTVNAILLVWFVVDFAI